MLRRVVVICFLNWMYEAFASTKRTSFVLMWKPTASKKIRYCKCIVKTTFFEFIFFRLTKNSCEKIYIFYLTFLTSNLFNYNKLQTKLNMQQLQHKKQTNNQNKTTTNTIHHTNSNENCHPFKYGKYTFMHNGGIPSFSKIKRQVLNLLSERVYQDIKGSTDSEHLFAIFLDYVLPLDESINMREIHRTESFESRSRATSLENAMAVNSDVNHMISAVNKMISTFVNLCTAAGIAEPCSINICVSDGTHIIATRFRNGPQNPPSLYYNYGSDFVCDDGNFYSSGDTSHADSVVISSAPLSRVRRCKYSAEPCDKNKPIACSTETAEMRNNMDSEGTTTETSDEHNGSWVLMPKDSMLVCRGDPNDAHKITSIQIQPIVITGDTGALSPSKHVGAAGSGSKCMMMGCVAGAVTTVVAAAKQSQHCRDEGPFI
jgi:predicted glutamine amidotransferase